MPVVISLATIPELGRSLPIVGVVVGEREKKIVSDEKMMESPRT